MITGAIDPNLLQRLHQTELHLEELLQGHAKEQTVYPGASLCFVTLYVAMNFDVLSEQLLESFSVSTHIGFMPVMPQLIVELE
uniref:Gag-pol protein n=1 Tax=Solanum tuberosum TaxID=4113 RepID=M1DIM0_SOLTU